LVWALCRTCGEDSRYKDGTDKPAIVLDEDCVSFMRQLNLHTTRQKVRSIVARVLQRGFLPCIAKERKSCFSRIKKLSMLGSVPISGRVCVMPLGYELLVDLDKASGSVVWRIGM
jgi:hypothetical protein